MSRNYPNANRSAESRKWLGLILLVIGAAFLLRRLDIFYFSMRHTWPILLIVIGLLIGMRNRFSNVASWILIVIGVANLIPGFYILGVSSRELVAPVIIICAGLYFIMRPRKRFDYQAQPQTDIVTTAENILQVDVTFGGRKEIVTSKAFRGGQITTTFGGCEVNLMQADSPVQPMILDLKVAFGGLELIVPSHWELQIEIDPSFGSIQDQRQFHTPQPEGEKRILILRGSVSFGSVEIKSY